MPYCEQCAKYFTPNAMTVDGDCPACGRHIAENAVEVDEPSPWHFKLLVALTVVYLVWRFADMLR